MDVDLKKLLDIYINDCKNIFDSKSYLRLMSKGYFYDNTNLL